MEASDERRSATVVASDDRLSATVAARSDRSIDSKISCTNFYNRERIMMQLHLPNDPLVPTLALVIPRYGAVCATLPDDYIWKVLQVFCTRSKPNSNACSMHVQ
ncbi:uncharacterized protein LOC114274479 isoform X7 [Camellia sinensis]|uniref:uncharacterized protein LOC114274479 isoform X7 n=1 Tax=Camellia sinensis TaxID=4442 RepID=UPI0010357981|nr:uncharacterized protein LOC114274479 isoform X7 [Camellia sinensis]XP_028072214.1 uncharacterized protein LOC114274479 isoform X7 [Camellia sinensis]XP_028072216.1 uncharacterized protein LOC114274479 isoform X7 [Camellia sinensis]XP_028072217.1 uncharacterized protein LOC114274479 isoform X7 [Camellia sinensis]